MESWLSKFRAQDDAVTIVPEPVNVGWVGELALRGKSKRAIKMSIGASHTEPSKQQQRGFWQRHTRGRISDAACRNVDVQKQGARRDATDEVREGRRDAGDAR